MASTQFAGHGFDLVVAAEGEELAGEERVCRPRSRQRFRAARAGWCRTASRPRCTASRRSPAPEAEERRPAMAVKNEKQYEALKDKGMSKERAARIANSPGASKRGGKSSGSGGSSKQGGTTAQKKAAGRKGGKATAKKSS